MCRQQVFIQTRSSKMFYFLLYSSSFQARCFISDIYLEIVDKHLKLDVCSVAFVNYQLLPNHFVMIQNSQLFIKYQNVMNFCILAYRSDSMHRIIYNERNTWEYFNKSSRTWTFYPQFYLDIKHLIQNMEKCNRKLNRRTWSVEFN